MTGLSRAFALLLALTLAACNTADTLAISPPSPVVVEGFDPDKYAAIVVDASSGQTLYQANANASRYPASLTKMMTLYLLFEAIDEGRVARDARIPVSANAASRPPSKLGLRPGESIAVPDAVNALCVKSANDVATAVAEFLGGSEENFARMMTAKARSLGMTATVFRNASGLPDAGQRSTARDMAVLGLALRKRFPHHYHLFGQTAFAYAGKSIRGHNRLLEEAGIDGIKTGYIRASGFNVATSVRRNGRSLVVVVMGGKSAKARNGHVADLIDRHIPRGGAIPGVGIAFR
ncbi:MAG: D-alanyl-D-alanine carboxypeptidase [Rhizobiaceae bacterium]|nr:D-alanyl-D-alanine carboxypeptidase [Rhizobiaceae bacterium]MCV0405130.1 D-alanyl-D-alanine carboxypeptidase [Rhizobiaceae bacterium]